MSATPGYSGTPLVRKLGIVAGSRVLAIGAPADYRALLAPLPEGVVFARAAKPGVNVAHVFVTARAELARQLASLRKSLASDAAVWVSWPKKASKVPTDVTEDVVRAEALKLDLVDVKVAAIDETWSGLKLVIRKDSR